MISFNQRVDQLTALRQAAKQGKHSLSLREAAEADAIRKGHDAWLGWLHKNEARRLKALPKAIARIARRRERAAKEQALRDSNKRK